jgi:hypothetical protein
MSSEDDSSKSQNASQYEGMTANWMAANVNAGSAGRTLPSQLCSRVFRAQCLPPGQSTRRLYVHTDRRVGTLLSPSAVSR